MAADGGDEQIRGEAYIWGPEWSRSPVVMLGHLGSHYVWSILNSRAAPFLMRLGFSKSTTAIVLMGGPLSGLLVQPVIGILSDECPRKWGRRRPYMLGGAILCLAALVCLAIASNAARTTGNGVSWLAILLGVLGIIGIDVSVNTLSAAHRALALDILRVDEQDLGNAWAARFGNLGSVLGYLVGELDLSSSLDLDHLSILALSAAVLLVLTHLTVFLLIDEQVLVRAHDHTPKSLGRAIRDMVRHLYRTGQSLPPPIWDLFKIQFFSWLAWFPILYFSSSWVADIYFAAHGTPPTSSGPMSEAARRKGSFALLCYSLTSFAASIALPWCLHGVMPGRSRHDYAPAATTVWSADDPPDEELHAPKPHEVRVARAPQWTRHFRKPTLAEAWFCSQVMFVVGLLFFTCPIYAHHSVPGAVALIGTLGLCWSMTLWAPYALLGILLNTTSTTAPESVALNPLAPAEAPEAEAASAPEPEPAGLLHAHAGAVMGLHNWSIVLPQLITSLLSSLCTFPGSPSFHDALPGLGRVDGGRL